MTKFCQACGMPMNKKEDFALGDETSDFCLYCVDSNGNVKTCEEIFAGGVDFFMNTVGSERSLAEKITRKNMKKQPYWQNKDCKILDGDEATDEEFSQILKKLQ